MVGVNDTTDSMTFAPSSPVSGIGGFINYDQPGAGTVTIAVYNALNVILHYRSWKRHQRVPGLFREHPEIAYFTLTGAFIGPTDLTVPEPAAISLALTGARAVDGYAKADSFGIAIDRTSTI